MGVPPDIEARMSAVSSFDFRNVLPGVRFGTASDRYAGWVGQIYDEHWLDQASSRQRRLGKRSFKEQVLPTETVREYFEHFSVLELDFTFYRPLREKDGRYSTNHAVVQRYLDHAPSDARFLVKAPQMFTAPFVRGVGRNPDYLDPDGFMRLFQEPLVQLGADRIGGVIFEQGYQPVKSSPPVDMFVERLDRFFESITPTPQVHVEVRSPHLLQPLYFDWLETRGLGFVFSHWTWLPSIKTQWKKAGRFTSADSTTVIRLLTPRKMTYAQAYAAAHPFDNVKPALSGAWGAREMIADSVALVYQAASAQTTVELITNNRAWGNAPELSAELAKQILRREGGRTN
jgi:uncharacterized protein YecE (DUF72 family)